MTLRNQLFGIGSAMLILFSSCQKDLTAPQESIQSSTVSSNATAEDAMIETAAPILTPLTTTVNANCAGYYELLPSLYPKTTKSYPLILFIHGIGELGTGVTRLMCCGLPYYAYKKVFPADFNVNGKHFSVVMMAPQFKVRPTPADMQNCIDYAKKKYRIDPSRIYICGLSMGGGSTWDYTAVYGQNVAAAVPVCGGTAPTQALAASIASRNLPVWTISSKADQVVPISWATNWVSWINAANPSNAANVHLTTYTAEDHNATWSKAFNPATTENGINIYQWMLRYSRNGSVVSAPPPTTPDTTTTTPTNPTTPTTPAATPVAKAGADVTIHKSWGFSPLLNGTLSTSPSGTWFTKGGWARVAGPSDAVIVNSDVIQTRVSCPTVGTYTFRLTVTNTKGVSATDDVNVVVLP